MKIIKFVSETKELYYSIFTLVLGFVVSFAKVFRFKANFFHFELDYPILFATDNRLSNHTLVIVFLVFNSICDFINGTLFLIVSLVIDVSLVVKLKKTLNEKEEKAKNMKSVKSENKK